MPVSIEATVPGMTADFYDKSGALDYGAATWDYVELQNAARVIDCRELKRAKPEEEYHACAHVALESWLADKDQTPYSQFLETPRDLGALGEQHWWVTKFTVERDPTVATYIGLAGEENRRKLAEMFKRPTTWKTYCEEVSNNTCATDDGVAVRAPIGPDEEESMFVEGLYIGHFRATEENDCDNYPDTCTGHITDYPCTWTSFVTQQTYHLDIALESNGPSPNGGYTYSQIYQIWAAANA